MRMDWVSSWSFSSSNSVLGCSSLGEIRSSGRLSNFSKFSGRVAGGGESGSFSSQADGAVTPGLLSLLGRSAESPLPSALR